MNQTLVSLPITLHPSETGLTADKELTYEEWEDFGRKLSSTYSKIQWQIGDWLNIGESFFGEKYAQLLDDLVFAYGTLRNYASICARIPPENRHPKLRFHQIKHVASLEPQEQRAIIDAAVKHEMTGDDIQEAVQRVRGKQPQTHESAQGVISRQYKQDDGEYLVIRLTVTSQWQVGRQVVVKAKGE